MSEAGIVLAYCVWVTSWYTGQGWYNGSVITSTWSTAGSTGLTLGAVAYSYEMGSYSGLGLDLRLGVGSVTGLNGIAEYKGLLLGPLLGLLGYILGSLVGVWVVTSVSSKMV